jgi:hypothetical protein
VGYFFVAANSNKKIKCMQRVKKFKVTNQFSFTTEDSLAEVCNASEGSGVF